MPQMCPGKKCRKCSHRMMISDNMIENQIKANDYLDNICCECSRDPNPNEFNLFLDMHCFEMIHKRKTVNFEIELDRQLILTDLFYGLNRDILCYFGRLYTKIIKGVFLLKCESNKRISIKWVEMKHYEHHPSYPKFSTARTNDVCIIFEENNIIFPCLIENLLLFDSIKYRRKLFEDNNFHLIQSNPLINDPETQDLLEIKIILCNNTDARNHRTEKTITIEELKNIILMYNCRCDECGKKLLLDYPKGCYYGFSINRIFKKEGFDYKNCRITCRQCADDSNIKIDRKFMMYLSCIQCNYHTF
jgi:hypothetical protein